MLFGEFLVSESVISEEQLEEGLSVQKGSSKRIGQILLELGHISKELLDHYLEIHLLNFADKIVEKELNVL